MSQTSPDETRAGESPGASSSAPASEAPNPAQSHATQLAASAELIWGPKSSIEDRLGDVQGSLRWAAIQKLYVKTTSHLLKIYDFNSGTWLARRHPTVNPRNVGTAVKRFVQGILQSGVISLMRGVIMLVKDPDSDHPDAYLVIGGATLLEAIKLAWQIAPTNAFVRQVMEEGIANCLVFEVKTPEDVLRWAKRVHNQYHVGSSFTIQEMYQEVDPILAAWQAHRVEKHITTANCPATGDFRYEKLFEKFVMTSFKGFYENWDHFRFCSSFLRSMKTAKLWDRYNTLLGDHCDVLRSGVKLPLVATHNNFIITTFRGAFSKTIDPELLNMAIFECLKFAIPFTDEDVQAHKFPPWLFEKQSQKTIQLVTAPMGGSVVYARLASPKGKAKSRGQAKAESTPVPEQLQEETDADALTSSRKRPKSKREQAQAKKLKVQALPEVMDKMAMGAHREKYFLDDLIACVTSPLQELDSATVMHEEVAQLIHHGLHFCFAAKLELNGTTYTAWSQLRKELRNQSIKLHSKAPALCSMK